MREAVGGSLLLYLIIPIIILIIVFIGFVMNYASVYRAANYVTSKIETCNGKMDENSTNICGHASKSSITKDLKEKYSYINGYNVCCMQNSKGSVFRTTLSVDFELPFFGKVSPFNVKVETKTIYNVSCAQSSFNQVCK